MANNLQNITDILLLESLAAMRENAILPRLVNTSYSPEPTEPGEDIQIPIPRPASEYDVTAGTPTTGTDVAPRKVTISTNVWKGTRMTLSDKEQTEIVMEQHVPQQLSEHIRAMANGVDRALLTEFINNTGGIYGTNSDPDALEDITAIMQRHDDQLCPNSPRHLVVDAGTKAKLYGLPDFIRADARGAGNGVPLVQGGLAGGRLGEIYGYDTVLDQNINSTKYAANSAHVAGTIGTNATGSNNQIT